MGSGINFDHFPSWKVMVDVVMKLYAQQCPRVRFFFMICLRGLRSDQLIKDLPLLLLLNLVAPKRAVCLDFPE